MAPRTPPLLADGVRPTSICNAAGLGQVRATRLWPLGGPYRTTRRV